MEWLETLNLLQKGRSPKTKQVFCTEAPHWLMAIRCSLCCCFSFLMENQGQRELKMIRHVYGVLVIHEVFQRIVWHTTFTLQHHSSGSDFWVSSSILAGTNVWPVTLELSKGKNDLHFQTMDKYCDDLLWLESLIDGWGQTLTLITEEITSLLASLTKSSHFLPSAECSPDGILHAFQQYMLCPIQVNIFFGLIPRLQVMMIHSIRKYCEGYSSSTGLKKMIKFCVVQSSAKTLIKCVLIFSLGGAYGVKSMSSPPPTRGSR